MAYLTGKEKASRIPLDYYKHPDRMVRVKRLLTWGAGALTVVWICTAFVPTGARSPLSDNRFSHGPVANAHQPIDSDCAACHVNFAVFASGKPFKGDGKCQQCHYADDLATHHASQKVDMTPNCGVCHSDHHGRDWNLNRVADRDCTTCHKDLKDSMKEGDPHYDLKVTSFADQHPEFRDLKNDPGKLKFNHKYHMTPGIVLTQGGKDFTLENIPEGSQRERYRQPGQKDTDAVKLECASCHTPEARDEVGKEGRPNPVEDRAGWEQSVQDYFRAKLERRGKANHNLLPPRRPGAYMTPIVYEKDCASCHPLSFDPAIKQQAPHRLQPAKLKEFLTNAYKENAKNPSIGSRPAAFLPLPGKRPASVTGSVVEERVDMALRALLEGKRACGECHLAKDGGSVNLYTKEIARPVIPEIWLKHARFDHSAHTSRGINCIECHKDAYPNKDPAVNERGVLVSSAKLRQGAEDVMIGNLKECRQCHSPRPEPKFAEAGLQARFDCAECHTYHNGKAGLGNAAGAFHGQPRRELEAWLRRPRGK